MQKLDISPISITQINPGDKVMVYGTVEAYYNRFISDGLNTVHSINACVTDKCNYCGSKWSVMVVSTKGPHRSTPYATCRCAIYTESIQPIREFKSRYKEFSERRICK